jgi:NhaP-type Na+/H+ or K+/H+ antiporter
MNDGLATPIVLFSVAAAAGAGHDSADHGLVEALMELVIGAVVGMVAGYLAGRLVELTRARGWAEQELLPIATLAVPLLCFYGAQEVHGNGFIAAFVAGTAFAASQATVTEVHEDVRLTGLTSTFLSFGVWMLFGVVVVASPSTLFSSQNVVYAVLSLTLLRVIPVALSLVGSGLWLPTVTFVGWFGPRAGWPRSSSRSSRSSRCMRSPPSPRLSVSSRRRSFGACSRMG